MATSSFRKRFIIKDKNAVERLSTAMESSRPFRVKTRAIDLESRKGIDLLKRSLSNSKI
ncbi:MAG TPA: hypothetical protein QF753_19250 [Victivallales bacterium]|nr:hypothetical protein [Victivallales bacterium]|tara:strand:+ start:573 stop:749 length:177 start_codon:yes stop_codon:yes gene_type:complete